MGEVIQVVNVEGVVTGTVIIKEERKVVCCIVDAIKAVIAGVRTVVERFIARGSK